MSRPRRALGYARVSSAEQALGTSLRDQQEAIRLEAKARGLSDVVFFVEAESAIAEKVERREQMRALLAAVREGDLVLVDKLDRWSRDTEHTLRTVREIAERGASFYAVSDRCDPAVREGALMLTIRAALAKEEHARIRERTVGTRRLLRDRGYYVEGRPPLGYARAHPKGYKGVEKNVLVIVPEDAERVREMFRLYVGGRSMQQIADEMGIYISGVKVVLARRVYVGEIKNSRGEWIKGMHPPIVDVATFARAQELRAERRLGGPRPRSAVAATSGWILRDVARCMHCGARMSAAYAGRAGAEGTRYYYRCAHRCEAVAPQVTNQSYVPVDIIEPQAAELVVARLVELREELTRAPLSPPKPRVDFAAKREKLARKRERYLEAFANELMTYGELHAAHAKLDAERLRLDAAEASSGAPDPAARLEALRDVRTLERAWKKADGPTRRKIVNQLAYEVRIAADELPSPRWRPVVELALDVL